MAKSRFGLCSLCGERRELTFEHVPPRSSFNNSPVYIKNHQHLFEKSGLLYGKALRSNRGYGAYTLCAPCNNNTGAWYANGFADFTRQGMEIISRKENSGYQVRGVYEIKPLNVIKQILTMFMSTDKMGYLRSQKDLVSFVLDKQIIGLPKRFKIYLFSTLSAVRRMIGYCIVKKSGHDICEWSEMNYQPFGYFLTINSKPAHEHMVDISNFGNIQYDTSVSVKITTPYLIIETPIIGCYGNGSL